MHIFHSASFSGTSLNMGYQYQIKNLEQVLRPYLKGHNKILKSTIKCLTQPGENYGSLMLSVDIVLTCNENKEKTLHLVAKMCPPNEWLRKMFNIPVTFKKEESIYKEVSLVFREFEQEYGIPHMTDFFPKYYGSRLSLDANSKEVDNDAVLLLENLKTQGYAVGDRIEGFDLQTSEAVVKALATFHAVALAVKIKKPEIFRKRIAPNVEKMKGFDELSDEHRQRGENIFIDVLKKYSEFSPYLYRIIDYYRQGEIAFQRGHEAREPFATIGHNDLWTNNMLIKKIDDQINVKFVDFQILDYGSPARDLIFFLYLSVQNPVAEEHDDQLIQLYYDTFISVLEKFKCDTQPFSYAEFEKELQHEAKASQVYHCLLMAVPIFTVKGTTKPMEELVADDMYDAKLSEKYEPKIVHIISSFIKKGWI